MGKERASIHIYSNFSIGKKGNYNYLNFRITSKVIRTVLRIVWAVVSIAFNIITNFIPYLLLSITTLSQSNELLTRGILLGVVKSDKKISDILQDRRKNEVPSRAKRVISQID